ncbi:pirin family protein [Mucilaginibacter glaciei]|uniref:Pirin family protein n=1 Tax=Mucilaginibacter glaciei TaxID=2772109 RepID=A0A926S0W5_9SPHI|nr:pirin family protein [Mucilaginibacter glaciei]MBD1392157.1 pirin family protein [Mucilaginibacter glaciei]
MKNTIIHRANTRGVADLGWLKSYQTFSFSGYYNPERMRFGVLRVLNDDIVDGSKGFGDHPHDNMEIISIPLQGELVHKDSMGNEAVIKPGEIQVMSAGTGIYHTEFNKNDTEPVKFLQIWVYPNKRNVTPRYDQIAIPFNERNVLHQILSPNTDDNGVWIYQNAWFNMGEFDAGKEINYQLNDKANGVYVFVLNGDITVNGQHLNTRDGMGLWDTDQLNIKANTDTQVLLMEVPMEL